MTRSPFYPLADRSAQWFSTATGPARSSNRAVVWHTTEAGDGWPSYTYDGQRGGSAPHFTCKADTVDRKLVWRQHWRLDESARALVNAPGGVETNNSGVIQIELVGTAVPGDPGFYWPGAPDWALEGLAAFSRWLLAEWGIPLTDEGRRWVGLRRSGQYVQQTSSPSRLSGSAWLAARGHLGHQHVPENDHVDPGALNVPRMLALANGDDMPTLDEIGRLIDAKLAAFRTSLLTAQLGRSGPSVQVALQSGYAASTHAAEGTDAILVKLSAPPTVTLADRLDELDTHQDREG